MTETEAKTKICKCGVEFTPILGYNMIAKSNLCGQCRYDAEILKRREANIQTNVNRVKALKSPYLTINSTVSKMEVAEKSKKKVRHISEKGLVAKLDKIFSLFIRQRDSKDGAFKCISCGKIKPYKLADCGHYINRANMTTRYDEVNCNAQCSHCNRFREGNNQGYRKGLIRKYGEKEVDILEMKKHNTSRISSVELMMMIDIYKTKLKAGH